MIISIKPLAKFKVCLFAAVRCFHKIKEQLDNVDGLNITSGCKLSLTYELKIGFDNLEEKPVLELKKEDFILQKSDFVESDCTDNV